MVHRFSGCQPFLFTKKKLNKIKIWWSNRHLKYLLILHFETSKPNKLRWIHKRYNNLNWTFCEYSIHDFFVLYFGILFFYRNQRGKKICLLKIWNSFRTYHFASLEKALYTSLIVSSSPDEFILMVAINFFRIIY